MLWRWYVGVSFAGIGCVSVSCGSVGCVCDSCCGVGCVCVGCVGVSFVCVGCVSFISVGSVGAGCAGYINHCNNKLLGVNINLPFYILLLYLF